MAPKPGLDVPDRDSRHASCQCSAERARRVSLNDQEGGGLAQLLQDRRGDAFDVGMGILRSRASEPCREIGTEAIVGGVEAGMLAGEDQARPSAASRERPGDGGELDRFGTGADDEPDICRLQTSPSFGRINLRPQRTECKPC